jgi:hypothetical protein
MQKPRDGPENHLAQCELASYRLGLIRMIDGSLCSFLTPTSQSCSNLYASPAFLCHLVISPRFPSLWLRSLVLSTSAGPTCDVRLLLSLQNPEMRIFLFLTRCVGSFSKRALLCFYFCMQDRSHFLFLALIPTDMDLPLEGSGTDGLGSSDLRLIDRFFSLRIRVL